MLLFGVVSVDIVKLLVLVFGLVIVKYSFLVLLIVGLMNCFICSGVLLWMIGICVNLVSNSMGSISLVLVSVFISVISFIWLLFEFFRFLGMVMLSSLYLFSVF